MPGALAGDQLVDEAGAHDGARFQIGEMRVDQIAERRMALQPDAERQAEAMLGLVEDRFGQKAAHGFLVEGAQFQAAHPAGTTARLAFVLALYTAQRVSDVVRMGWQHVRGERIAVRQQKTNKPLLIKMHPELVRVLASVPKDNLTFLMTERGAPFTPAGLSNWFGKRCREAGLEGCSTHGLRKLALTRRANAGASTDMLKAFGGHATSKEVERYTREADQARLDEQGLELQLRAEREQDLSNLETRLDKKG